MEATINQIQKVGQVAIPVQDLDRAVTFYRDTLGLPLLFNTGNLAFFDCNGLRLLLSLPEKEEFAGASSIIYFQVKDIHETYQSLSQKEMTIVDKPHLVAKMGQTETWMFFFKDTENNTHAFMSELQSE